MKSQIVSNAQLQEKNDLIVSLTFDTMFLNHFVCVQKGYEHMDCSQPPGGAADVLDELLCCPYVRDRLRSRASI